MHATDTNIGNRQRVPWLDNLRTFTVFLVVLLHAGGVYEDTGIWAFFWIIDDPATNAISSTLNSTLDIFVMPLMFSIAGYLAPASLTNRGRWLFFKAKLKRLMIPWAFAVLTLVPLYKVLFLYSRGSPQEGWTTYFHWSNGVWNQNWLWFLPVLFLFHIVYLVLGYIKLPRVSIKRIALGAFLVGYLYSVGMDLLGWQGWTKTILLDFQNERIGLYLLAYLFGAYSFRLALSDARLIRNILCLALGVLCGIAITIYISFQQHARVFPGDYRVSALGDKLILWLCFYVSLFGLVILLVETFRRYVIYAGKVSHLLCDNTFGVYLIHVIVIGVFGLVLLHLPGPSLLKHLFLTVLTYGVSNLLVSLYKMLKIATKDKRRAAIL